MHILHRDLGNYQHSSGIRVFCLMKFSSKISYIWNSKTHEVCTTLNFLKKCISIPLYFSLKHFHQSINSFLFLKSEQIRYVGFKYATYTNGHILIIRFFNSKLFRQKIWNSFKKNLTRKGDLLVRSLTLCWFLIFGDVIGAVSEV